MTAPPLAIAPLATCTPPLHSRAWQSAPHPYLPLLATASSDRTVAIYSLTSFTQLSSITGGHKRSIRSVAWKPGLKGEPESTLATGSFDAAAGIWRAVNTHPALTRSGDATADEDDTDDEPFRFAVILEGHESEIKSVSWSCNGTFLATCSRDKSVWIWEALDTGASNMGPMAAAGPEDDDNYETVAVLQEHEGDVKTVAWHPSEESCLASGSYDDLVRVWREDLDGEWGCVGVCEGHDGTVWCVAWEPAGGPPGGLAGGAEVKQEPQQQHDEPASESGPRLLSCSDDLTIRVWRRMPKAKPKLPTGPRIPSIIRTSGDEETWYEEARLPTGHQRAVYSVAWSPLSRRVASAGSDGKIVVYEERVRGGGSGDDLQDDQGRPRTDSEWVIVAEVEAAHGVFEVNHVAWSRRYDKARRRDDEEVLVSTGDDGEVKVWTLA